jgi:hypothetical protein
LSPSGVTSRHNLNPTRGWTTTSTISHTTCLWQVAKLKVHQFTKFLEHRLVIVFPPLPLPH